MPLKIKFCPVCGFRFVRPSETDTACRPMTWRWLRPLGNRFSVWACSLCGHIDFYAWTERPMCRCFVTMVGAPNAELKGDPR